MGVTVAGDLMTLLGNGPKQLGMLTGHKPEGEESRPTTVTLEDFEQNLSVLDDPALSRIQSPFLQAIVVAMVPVLEIDGEDGLSGFHGRMTPARAASTGR